jgi:exopolysaccharide biosynthesis protein
LRYPLALQKPLTPFKDRTKGYTANSFFKAATDYQPKANLPIQPVSWKPQTAVGGGPVLLQEGKISVANNEELKFAGKAISDKHPRTAMGYTATGELIILAVQGRFPGKAEGLSLTQTALLLQEIGCVEALNLDGGGSSCLLVNGKETITPSDKEGQRAVPGVFMIKALR